MAALHIIHTPGAHSAALSNCLRGATPGDAVLLIGNGVLCGVAAIFARIASRGGELSWYALADDIATRGIGDRVAESIRQIDDGAFVDLVAAHQPIVSWS